MSDLTIGIDLGGTKIEAALIDGDGKMLNSVRVKTEAGDGADAVVDRIETMIGELTAKTNGNRPAAAGIGLAGQIDTVHGIVNSAPNLGWKDYPLNDVLQDKLDMPLKIDNDVRMAAYGEWKYGAGRNLDNLVCIFVGTGVGGGIISEGHLIHGQNNTAGEIGHTTVNLQGPSCSCGNFGCLEAYAGGWAIARTAKEIIAKDRKAGSAILNYADNKADDITAENVVDAARENDPLGLYIMRQASEALIAGCASLINIFSPQRLILGGGIIEGYREIIETIAHGIGRRALSSAMKNIEIVKAELGPNAGVIGAAASAHRLIK